MSGLDISQEGLNVLCIDSGGVRGLSALVLLEEIMKRMQTSRKLDFPPDPHQCFDVIAGTGTGGVQACMLGRLRMPVRPAIESYANLVKDVFSEKKRLGSGSFKTTKLKNSLRSIIRDATGDPEELMIEGKTMERQCKTLVFAMSSQNMRAGIPTTFRSYPIAANEGPKCTIWETLCATMVHPDLFKSFVIGGPLLNQSFVDGGLRCNNPLAYVLAEVKRIYPKRYVASITSIGMGHTRTIQIPNTVILRHLLPIAAIVAMKEIATDAERVAEDMARRFNSTEDVYFRLSVDQGMQNLSMDRWEQLNEVLEHTRTYMKLVDVSQRIDKLVQAIHSRKPIVPVVQIDGEIQITTASTSVGSMIRRCPAPTPIFTGCEFKLREIELCITGIITERKVCVVHGLGGAGKTQMVLKVIERTYNQWKEVIYVDASTEESIENALKDFAQIKKVGGTYQDGLGWLELHREPWLVVFDNADSPLLRLRNYMPRTSHGSVIITTRLSGMVSFAQGKHSDCSVSSMEPDDALALLLKSARKQDQELPPEEMEAANALLKELGHFALAIVHAGSFVGQSPHMSITEYKYLFMEGRQRALEAYNKSTAAVKIDDYEHTVYTAWLMCYEQLRLRAQELLWLIAYLHHTGITVDIFRRAATNILSYKPRFPTTLLEDSARQKLKEFLASFLDASYHWDGLLFSESINEIVSHSLLEYDRTNESYRIHVLVQSWVRTIMPWDADLAVECTRTLLSISMPTDNSLSSIMLRTSVGLHVDMALSGTSDKISANHALQFFMVYRERGQWKQAKQLGLQMRETSERVLGNDHPDTLSTMHNLALTYSNLNRLDEARDLQVQVLDAWKRVLGDDHPDTLSTMHNLALTYSNLNRLDEARDLQVQVLDTRKRVLGDDHPDTLSTMHNLAATYSKLNRLDEARDLEVQVLDALKRVLGDDHPHTLMTMHNLADTYSKLNRLDEARDLEVQVLDAWKRVLGDDHPDTLKTMHNLADTYSKLNRLDEARDLQVQVLDAWKRVLGDDHPDTLKTMHNLADTYSKLNRLDEARDLQVQVLDAWKRVLGDDHPHTLMTMHNLAATYSKLNRLDEARDLQVQVLDAWKRVLGDDHPDTLSTMHNLALTYSNLNRLDEARDLQVQVLDTRKRVLGDDHPDTLSTMHNLAATYSKLNRLDEARDLEVQVLDALKRVLGDDHPHTLMTMHNLADTYSNLNQLDEARDLEVQVLDALKRVLGDDHPHTLMTMHNLALTYSNLNQLDEARDLEVQVLDARKRVLGDDHPDTLSTMHNLAHTYLGLGLWEEAEKLQINVDKFVQVFGQNDERTCAARNQLRKIQGYREKHTDGSS